MVFTKRLRDPIRRGEVTCSVRIWQRPALARRSGFEGMVDLLKIAKHGPGERVFLVEFRYLEEAI